MKFRKKPVVIEAFQWTGEIEPFQQWFESLIPSRPAESPARFLSATGDGTLQVETLEGTMTAVAGDWIVRGVHGEFYPCKPDIFVETYDPVAAVPESTDPSKRYFYGLCQIPEDQLDVAGEKEWEALMDRALTTLRGRMRDSLEAHFNPRPPNGRTDGAQTR